MKTGSAAVAVLTGLGLLLGSALPALAQDVRAGVEQLAAQIAKGAPEGKQLRVAVADFPDLQGATSDFGRFVASRLTTRLAQDRRFFVIERQRLGQVLAELKFSMSDLVDPRPSNWGGWWGWRASSWGRSRTWAIRWTLMPG